MTFNSLTLTAHYLLASYKVPDKCLSAWRGS